MSDYLEMKRGDDRTLTVTASESMEGADLTFTAKRTPWDGDAVITKTTADGITIGDDPFTEATIEIDPSDTNDLEDTPIALHWDLQLEDAQGNIRTVADGRLAILTDITRPA